MYFNNLLTFRHDSLLQGLCDGTNLSELIGQLSVLGKEIITTTTLFRERKASLKNVLLYK